MKILVLDDDLAHTELITKYLTQGGHEVAVAEDGARAIRILEQAMVDFVILDWVVPVMSGLEVLHWIRRNIGYTIPILFLTNKIFEKNIAEALNSGADDYVMKPIGQAELIARVNALARRVGCYEGVPRSIEVGEYRVEAELGAIFFKGDRVHLTKKELHIACALFGNIGRVVPRDFLVKAVWGKSENMFSRSLDTHVYRVRNKLALSAKNGVILKSIYTIGYRLEVVGR